MEGFARNHDPVGVRVPGRFLNGSSRPFWMPLGLSVTGGGFAVKTPCRTRRPSGSVCLGERQVGLKKAVFDK